LKEEKCPPSRIGLVEQTKSPVRGVSKLDESGDSCVIDLDDCFDSSGKLRPISQSVVEAFSGCYMEHSPSGKGLHIFFKATGYDFDKTKYYINNRKLGVEVYVAGSESSSGGY
jgi:putative DNA primase/helicase